MGYVARGIGIVSPYLPVFLIMNHKQETECGRKSEIDPALVSRFGVRHIEPVFRVQVEEGRDGFVEGDAVLLEVGGGFGGVELKLGTGSA